MSTTLTAPPQPEGDQARPTVSRSRWRLEQWGLAVLAVIVAPVVAIGLSGLSLKAALLLPVGLAAAVVLGSLALVRFESFVLFILAIRSALDSTKLHGSGSNTGSGSGGLDPTAIVAVGFMVCAVLYFAAKRLESGQDDRPSRASRSLLRAPLIAFLMAAALSIAGSANSKVSLFETLRVAAVVVMLLVLDRVVVDERSIRRVLVAVFASAILPLTYAAVQALRGGGVLIGGFTRIQGTFVHPNPFSIYLTFLIIMGVALLPHVRGRPQLPLLIVIGGCTVCLLLTYTRSAYIATFMGIFVVGLYQSPKLVGVLLACVVVIGIAVPSVSSRFSDLQHSQRVSGAAGNSLIWRVSYWKEVASLANGNPVTGIGLKMIEGRTDAAKNAHNDFLRVYVETGLLGLGAYIWFLIEVHRTALRARRAAPKGLMRGLAVGFTGCYVAFLLLSIVSNVISQVVLLWYFVAFAAAVSAVAHLETAPGTEARAGDRGAIVATNVTA